MAQSLLYLCLSLIELRLPERSLVRILGLENIIEGVVSFQSLQHIDLIISPAQNSFGYGSLAMVQYVCLILFGPQY